MTAPNIVNSGRAPIAKVTQLAGEVYDVADGWGYVITRFYGSTTFPDHSNRRCLDIVTSSARKKLPDGGTRPLTLTEQIELGTRLRTYLVGQVKRLKITGIIWNRKVTGFPPGAYRGPYGVERTYQGKSEHRDHLHVEVAPGLFVALPLLARVRFTRAVDGYYGPKRPGVKVDRPWARKKAGDVVAGRYGRLNDGLYIIGVTGTYYPVEGVAIDLATGRKL